jgi:hypothetical protein
MISLREAIDQGKLDQFIAEHDGEIGDREAFEATVRAMAGKSKEAPEACPPDGSDD